jgi:hypothetical protein
VIRANHVEKSKDFLYDPRDPVFDDEYYTSNGDVNTELALADNDTIRGKLFSIFKEYSAYNKALIKAKHPEDEVDKTMLASEYDTYDLDDEVVKANVDEDD